MDHVYRDSFRLCVGLAGENLARSTSRSSAHRLSPGADPNDARPEAHFGPSLLSALRSNSIEIPWPPPMHMVTRPVRAPLRAISYISLTGRIAPLAPTGWPSDRAAVDVNAGRVETQIVHHRQRLSGESLIEFN